MGREGGGERKRKEGMDGRGGEGKGIEGKGGERVENFESSFIEGRGNGGERNCGKGKESGKGLVLLGFP